MCKSISQKKDIQISHFDVISLISNARKIFCSKKKTYWTQLGIEPKLNPNSIEQKILTIELPDISLLKTRVSVCLVYSTISELKQNFGLLFVWLEKKNPNVVTKFDRTHSIYLHLRIYYVELH